MAVSDAVAAVPTQTAKRPSSNSGAADGTKTDRLNHGGAGGL